MINIVQKHTNETFIHMHTDKAPSHSQWVPHGTSINTPSTTHTHIRYLLFTIYRLSLLFSTLNVDVGRNII